MGDSDKSKKAAENYLWVYGSLAIFIFLLIYYTIPYSFSYYNLKVMVGKFVFCSSPIMAFLLSAAFVFIFYVIGTQIKKIFAIRYVTTGIVIFFGITFLFNMVLALFSFSSASLETYGLFIFIGYLGIRYIKEIRSNKARVLISLLLLLSFLLIHKISTNVTISRVPLSMEPFADEIHSWYPKSIKYFENGLVSAMKHGAFQGYGLFVHHVWVTTKRLILFSPHSSYYLIPQLLLLLGSGFIIELWFQRGVILFGLLLYVFSIGADDWLRFLLMNGLYGEGVTALFFTILLREILCRDNSDPQNFTDRNSMRTIGFWSITGLLSQTKPFVSYFCFLLPFFYTEASSITNNWKWFKGAVKRLIPMFVFPAIWFIISKMSSTQSAHYSLSLPTRIDFGVIMPILKHWTIHRMTLNFYIFSILCGVFGLFSKEKSKTFSLLFFVVLNFLLIYGLYATVWVDLEKESAFRYFSETYYLCLSVLMLGCSEIYKGVESQIRKILNKFGSDTYDCIRKSRYRRVKFAWFTGCLIVIMAISIFMVLHIGQNTIIYSGFHDREKWPNRNYFIRWSKSESRISLKKAGVIELVYICSHPDVDTQPVILTVSLNGSPIDRISFSKRGEIIRQYQIPDKSDGDNELNFRISRTWNPHKMKLSADTRELGVAVSEVRYLKRK